MLPVFFLSLFLLSYPSDPGTDGGESPSCGRHLAFLRPVNIWGEIFNHIFNTQVFRLFISSIFFRSIYIHKTVTFYVLATTGIIEVVLRRTNNIIFTVKPAINLRKKRIEMRRLVLFSF